MSKRHSARKYDQQKFPEILAAIRDGKYSVRKPVGPKYRQENTWEKWRLIFDEADNVIKDYFYCVSCSSIYNLKLANSGRCLKVHAIECIGPENSKDHIDEHFSPAYQPAKKRKIAREDKIAVKEAATDFVVSDMRPICSIGGKGITSLLATMTRIGAKYGAMSLEDLEHSKLVPSRYTVRLN